MVLVGDWKSELLGYYPSCKPLIIDTNIIGNKTRMIGRGSLWVTWGACFVPGNLGPLSHHRWSQQWLVNCHLYIIKVTLTSKQEHRTLLVLFFRTCSKLCAYEEAYDRGTLLVISWLAGCIYFGKSSQFILLLYWNLSYIQRPLIQSPTWQYFHLCEGGHRVCFPPWVVLCCNQTSKLETSITNGKHW